MRRFEKVADGISLLKVPFFNGDFDTGVVLVESNGLLAMIDSGEAEETVQTCILPALAEQCPDGVRPYLLCTHTHGDHIGGHEYLRRHRKFTTAATVIAARHLPGGAPELILEDGEQPIPGLRIFEMPGHAPDAVCYLHEKTGTLITGDCFQGCGTDGVGLALIEDPALYRSSIAKAMEFEAERIVAGHGFAPCDFIISGAKRVHAFLQCCLDTANRYEDYLAKANVHCEDAATLTINLIKQEHRIQNVYITRGDSTITAMLRHM